MNNNNIKINGGCRRRVLNFDKVCVNIPYPQNVVQSERLLLVECSVHTVTVYRLARDCATPRTALQEVPVCHGHQESCCPSAQHPWFSRNAQVEPTGTSVLSVAVDSVTLVLGFARGHLPFSHINLCVSSRNLSLWNTYVYPRMLYFSLFEIRSPYVALSGLKLPAWTRLASDCQRPLHFCCSLLGLWLCTAMPAQGTYSFVVGQILVDFVCFVF